MIFIAAMAGLMLHLQNLRGLPWAAWASHAHSPVTAGCLASRVPQPLQLKLLSNVSCCHCRDDAASPKPERSAMSSMGFTCSQPSHSRLPSFTGATASASSSSQGTQRSGLSFSRKGRSFTRESTPVSTHLSLSAAVSSLR